MSRRHITVASHRLHRAWPLPRYLLLRKAGWWGGPLLLAAIAGWWGRVDVTHAALAQTRDAVLALERQVGLQGPAHPLPALFNALTVADSHQVAMSDDDVSALVRWHGLLREQQLQDWQGRSVPATSTSTGTGDHSGGGAVWRLEGQATYEQGMALLNTMVRQFPRLVMLQVHVHQVPHTELLHWRLELRWSAPLPALAQRWPAGGALASTQGTNPFAANRLPLDINTTNPSGATSALAEVSRHHVLPQAPLQDIRLIGVVGQDDERVALVTWTAVPTHSSPNSSSISSSKPGRGSLSPKSHRIRLGQYLGVERTQVVAIEPQALVLQSSGPAHRGHRPGRREVLALANVSTGFVGEGVGHE